MLVTETTSLSAPNWAAAYPDAIDVAEAEEQWRAVMADLHVAGTLAEATAHTVSRLVEFRVQYRKAARHVAEHGAILKAKKAAIGQWNPMWSAMQQADARISHLESKLGLDPISRGKTTKVASGKRKQRAADAYLKTSN